MCGSEQCSPSDKQRPKRVGELLFGEDGFRKGVFVPVVINLATALLIFLFVAIFRNQIYERLMPAPKIKGFPLYCVAEGYNNDSEEVLGEVFIINLTGEIYDEGKLVSFIKSKSSDGDTVVDPTIRFKWIGGTAEVVLSDDTPYNAGKGKLRIVPSPDGKKKEWTIHIEQIADRAIMKVRVTTTLKRPLDRSNQNTRPFTIIYGGEQ